MYFSFVCVCVSEGSGVRCLGYVYRHDEHVSGEHSKAEL